MGMNMQYRCVLKDKHGNVKHDSGFLQSRSFVKNFMIGLAALLNHGLMPGVVRLDGNTTYSAEASGNYAYNVLRMDEYVADQISPGIIVGSSAVPVLATNHALGNVIVAGSDPGELEYGYNVPWSAPFWNETEQELEMFLNRAFTNASGATIQINEIGLISWIQYSTGSSTYYFDYLIARDVLDSTLNVADGDTVNIQYRIYVAI